MLKFVLILYKVRQKWKKTIKLEHVNSTKLRVKFLDSQVVAKHELLYFRNSSSSGVKHCYPGEIEYEEEMSLE